MSSNRDSGDSRDPEAFAVQPSAPRETPRAAAASTQTSSGGSASTGTSSSGSSSTSTWTSVRRQFNDADDPSIGGWEYQDVLCGWEKAACDRIVAVLDKCCGSPSSRFKVWEGIRPDVPESHQRWESIRERHPVLALLFALFGAARPQPTKLERVFLLLLYAGAWYMCYFLSVVYFYHGCEAFWVSHCVPTDLGGGCVVEDGHCAPPEVLEQTPRQWKHYEEVLRGGVMMSAENAKCLDESSIEDFAFCDMPLCAADTHSACYRFEREYTGFCACRRPNFVLATAIEMMFYMVVFKILWLPWHFLLRVDMHWAASWATTIILTVLCAFLWLIIPRYFYDYTGSWRQVSAWTVWWLFSFLCLCWLEVVRAFFLGYLFAAYVIERCCCWSSFARMWKFCLA